MNTHEESAVREPAHAEGSQSVPFRIYETSVTTIKKFGLYVCDPQRQFYRYTVLVLVCMLTVGSYYCYDILTALQRTIIHVMQIDSTRFNIFISVNSWANTIIPIICGFFLDRIYGIRIGTLIFSVIICVGQLVIAFGVMFKNFPVMVVGRITYAIIDDSLQVAQNVFATMWFKPNELSRVFGLILSFSRAGSTLSLNANPRMYHTFEGTKQKRLGGIFLVGFAVCILSLLCAIVLGVFDKRAERILQRKKNGEKIHPKDIKEFPRMYWLVVNICVTYYVTVIPFVGFATKFLMDKYRLTYSEANMVNSLVYIIPAATSPIFGYFVDKSGYNLNWLNCGIIITLVARGIFSFLPSATFIPYLAMILMGIAYSIIGCVLWPLVAFIISDYQLGTAYGILQAIENLGLAIVIILAGVILENHGYLILEIIFEGLLCLSLFSGICLYKLDSNSGGQLNMSGCSRSLLESGNAGRRAVSINSELTSNYPTAGDASQM